ncbi:MAG: hypothetical protein JO010_13815 [Alphaproteobacteria bacterium]|nr:hypothetical protein [Alphaproteobacteria bacterium]
MRRLGRPVLLLLPVDPADPCPRWREMARAGGGEEEGPWTCAPQGAERVEGRDTVKFAARSATGAQATLWVDPALRFIVKSADGDGRGIALHAIIEAPQPASLFAVPSEYEDLELQEMMRLMFQPGMGRTPRN